MPIKSPISEFCDSRGISGQLKSAFGAYIRSMYAYKFKMGSDSETIHLVLGRLSQEQLEEAWQDFIKELARHLT